MVLVKRFYAAFQAVWVNPEGFLQCEYLTALSVPAERFLSIDDLDQRATQYVHAVIGKAFMGKYLLKGDIPSVLFDGTLLDAVGEQGSDEAYRVLVMQHMMIGQGDRMPLRQHR